MLDFGSELKEVISNEFRGKALFKFNLYESRELNKILKRDKCINSFEISFVMERIVVDYTIKVEGPKGYTKNDVITLDFKTFIGYGNHYRTSDVVYGKGKAN